MTVFVDNLKNDIRSDFERRLRQDIYSNKLCGGDRLNSESHFMRRYRMTRYQVRKVIGTLEREGLLRSVRGSGTYIIPVEERGLKSEVQQQNIRSRQILFLYFTNEMSEELLNRAEIYDPIFNGLSKILHHKGYNFLFAKVDESMQPPPCMKNKDIDGIVFFGNPGKEFHEQFMTPFQCVGINSYNPTLDCNFVEEDDFSRSFKAVEYLYGLGHRRIGFFSDCSQLHLGPRRYMGFLNAITYFGLPLNPEWIVNFQQQDFKRCTSPWSNIPDYTKELKPALNASQKISAIVCIDDPRALAVKTALEKLGQTIPEDISIVGGYSYRQIFGNFTSICGNLENVCAEAACVLIDTLEKKTDCIRGRTIMIRPQLSVGDSTAAYADNSCNDMNKE